MFQSATNSFLEARQKEIKTLQHKVYSISPETKRFIHISFNLKLVYKH